ncbi:class III lanthionine synthetase LanKC [Streptomyces sp. NPDC051001]|uniref:class III lanthionine synthetase LanKC n=1 Tax=Streptomyces sp. NPDC051001 TaxID=3155795 RepID=UPI0034260FDE
MAITDFVPAAKDFVPYCVADSLVFDTPSALPDADSRFDAALRPAPAGWDRGASGLNVSMRPVGAGIPEQGWKIHVSTTVADAARAIEAVWSHCVENSIAFKFLRSSAAVVTVNSKYWPRGSSGKVITIYPRDHEQLTRAMHTLASSLEGIRGPYILSDLRYGDGPLFVRYGAFVPMWCTGEDGAPTAAIRGPDGNLVPDVRTPVFSVPEFVDVPQEFERDLRDVRRAMDEFPYAIESALRFSNAGGVYLGRPAAPGEQVVLKEARPHAGIDSNGDDAVARLANEHAVLSRLQGLTCVPRVIEYVKAWEHWFLVTNYVEGVPLLNRIIHKYPLVHAEPSTADLEAYFEWVETIVEKIRRAVTEIHERGVAVGDVHPSNVIISADDDITLVDLENAYEIAGGVRPGLGAPGFAASSELSPSEADWQGVERIRLMALLPVVPIVALDQKKSSTLRTVAEHHLGLGIGEMNRSSARAGARAAGGFGTGRSTEAGATPTRAIPTGRDRAADLFDEVGETWPAARDALVAGITSSATPERDDRLFPGDPLQFTFGGANLAYGAAGTLLALLRAGKTVEPDHLAWLAAATLEGRGYRGLGLYDGVYGAAYVLHLAGAREQAIELVDRAATGPLPQGWGLFGGRAGVALSLLHFGRVAREPKWETAGLRLGDELRRAILNGAEFLAPRPGLLQGATGPALVFLHLHKLTGDESYLRAARVALGRDLSAGALLADGTFHIGIGTRYIAYLDAGSAGVGLVLARYLATRDDPEFSVALDGIVKACRIPFVMQPGLFQGRSGMIALLSQVSGAGELPRSALEQARRLAWHAVLYREGIAFPGRGLHRLSFDLGTGSAGVLLVLSGAMGGGCIPLPFLGAAPLGEETESGGTDEQRVS